MQIPRDDYVLIAGLLRDARVSADMTQIDVAAALGVPQSFVSKYESAERRLDLLEFLAICTALKCSATELLQRIETNFSGAR